MKRALIASTGGARARRLRGRARTIVDPRPGAPAQDPFLQRPLARLHRRRAAGPLVEPVPRSRCSIALVEEALRANTDLRVAAANLRRARARAARDPRRPACRPPTFRRARPTAGNRATSSASPAAAAKARATMSASTSAISSTCSAASAAPSRRAAPTSEPVQAAFDVSRITVAAETARAYADACSAGRQLAVARETRPHPGADLRSHPPAVRRRPRHRARDQPGRRAARADPGDDPDARGAAPDRACSACRC